MSGEAVDALWFMGGFMAACLVFLAFAIAGAIERRERRKKEEAEAEAKKAQTEAFAKFGKKGKGGGEDGKAD